MTLGEKINLSVCGLLLVLFVTLCYELVFGKLFPVTPVIIGFTKYELPRASLIV